MSPHRVTLGQKVYFFSKINLSPGLMFRQHKNSPGSHTFSGSHGRREACVMLIWNNAPLSIVIHSTHCLDSGGQGTLEGLIICSHTRTAFPSLPLSHHPPVLAFPGNGFPGASWWIFLSSNLIYVKRLPAQPLLLRNTNVDCPFKTSISSIILKLNFHLKFQFQWDVKLSLVYSCKALWQCSVGWWSVGK